MERYLELFENRTTLLSKIDWALWAFVLLFFSETSYYLLILQTGIVDCFGSNLAKIWMIPVGGVLGILTINRLQARTMVVRIALLLQTLLMFAYPNFSGVALFVLGVLSGLVAPYLIYQLRSLEQVVVALALAYVVGTFGMNILPEHRAFLAIVLSVVALFFSLFFTPFFEKEEQEFELKSYASLFLWLVLDATLFETLSRSSSAIWGNDSFSFTIASFHLLGLFIGYKLSSYKHNNRLILVLFALSYLFFMLHFQSLLAMVYPIVISYYNVIILKRFMTLSFERLTLVSLSLCGSAGIGLSIALLISHHLI